MRSYEQFCALARALDLVGQRWTLLIVRELLPGPRRYGALLDGLPGIGTNLLADRLRELEQAEVVRRARVPGDARGEAYELTARGRALEPALLELARWGMTPMAPPAEADRKRPSWYLLAMRAAFRPESAERDELYELTLDGETFHLGVEGGRAVSGDGPARNAALRLRADLDAFLMLATGGASARALERAGRLSVDGSREALRRWQRAFGLPKPALGSTAGRPEGHPAPG